MDRVGKHIPISKRFKKGVDQDTFISFELASSNKSLINYDINSVVNVEDVFSQERRTSRKYRFSGRLNIITANELSPDAKDYDWDPLFDGPEKETPNNWLLQIVRPSKHERDFEIESYDSDEKITEINNIREGLGIKYVTDYKTNVKRYLKIIPYHNTNTSGGDFIYLYSPTETNPYQGIHEVLFTNGLEIILNKRFTTYDKPKTLIKILEPSDSDINFSDPFNILEVTKTNVSGNTCGNCDYIKIKTDGKINININNYIDFRSPTRNGIFKVVNIINECEFVVEFPFTNLPEIGGVQLRELDGTPSEYYVRYFEVMTTNQYETYKAGFSSNIYPDTITNELGVSNGTWLFHYNQDLNFLGLSDNRGGEVSEVYLALIKRSGEITYNWSDVSSFWEHNKTYVNESFLTLEKISNNVFGGVGTIEKSELGDTYIGDVVEYNRLTLKEVSILSTAHFFRTNNFSEDDIEEGYYIKPFKKLTLRVYSEDIETAEEDETIINLPDNFETYPDGTIAWRDLLQIGFLEPGNEGNRGVDYPFVNGAHYFYTNQNYYVRNQDPTIEIPGRNEIITINSNNIC